MCGRSTCTAPRFSQGPYRSSYSTYCRELQSPVLTLLARVPNGRLGVGNNRDAFLPNPGATSALELQMFEFLGKLMGIAARNKVGGAWGAWDESSVCSRCGPVPMTTWRARESSTLPQAGAPVPQP